MTRKRILSKVDDLAGDIMSRMNKSIQRFISLKETASTALKMLRIELVKGLETNSSDSHQKYLQDVYFDIVTRWRSELRDIDFRANQLEQTMQEKIFPVKLFGELGMRHRADVQPEKVGSFSDTLVGLSDNCGNMRKAKSKSDHCGVEGDGHAHRKQKSHRKVVTHEMSTKLEEEAQVMTLRKRNRRHRQPSSRNSKLRFPKVNQGLHSNLVGVRSPSTPCSPKPASPWQGVFIGSPGGDNDVRPRDLTTSYTSTRRENEIKDRMQIQNGDHISPLQPCPQNEAGDGIKVVAENMAEPTWAITKETMEYPHDGNCTLALEPEASEDDGALISKSQDGELSNSDSHLKFDDSDSVILKKSSVTTILMSDEDETVEANNCLEDNMAT